MYGNSKCIRAFAPLFIVASAALLAACGDDASPIGGPDASTIDAPQSPDAAQATDAPDVVDATHAPDAAHDIDAATTIDALVPIDAAQAPDATPLSASFQSSLLASDAFPDGNGSVATPLLVPVDNGGATISITYANVGTGAATGFSTNGSLAVGWTVQSRGCSNVTMQVGDSCTDVYALSTSSVGTFNFDVSSSQTATWNDGTGHHANQTISGVGTVFTSVFQPVITITTDLVEGVAVVQDGIITVTATLTNGDAVDVDQVISLAAITPITQSISLNPETCVVSSSALTCQLTIDIADDTVVDTYDVQLQNSGDVQLVGADIQFDVAQRNRFIFVTTSTFDGNLGGFSGANFLCNQDASLPNASTYKALLDGNNATTAGSTYDRPDGTTVIAVATGGNLATNLVKSIGTASGAVWTGSGGSQTCSNWSTNAGLPNKGQVGVANSVTASWLSSAATVCSNHARLFCVEQ